MTPDPINAVLAAFQLYRKPWRLHSRMQAAIAAYEAARGTGEGDKPCVCAKKSEQNQ